jgi:mannose-1-phosphate guanylyltransferase/mannose-6-phosphate isomerase
MAGGKGSRLWPHSRTLLPKQFINFPNHQGSLFQNTLARLEGLNNLEPPIVVCNEEQRFLVGEQLRETLAESAASSTVLLEPIGRNTAPAVAIAAMEAINKDSDVILLVLPADHIIRDNQALHKAIVAAAELADQEMLVTFGIVPDVPETGYGYIKKGAAIDSTGGFGVDKFVEKPDLETAQSYLNDGGYLWNSGMFMFKASAYLGELEKHQPLMFKHCKAAHDAVEREQDFARIPLSLFKACPSDSIDYAVMEKSDNVAVIPLDAAWNDLGSWSALWDVSNKDENQNALSGDVVVHDVARSYIQAGSRLVTAVGMQDAIIVETTDAVLVAAKDSVQEVKQIVDMLQARGRLEVDAHNLVSRPWGTYESLMNVDGFQVKHIVVKPGASLSLQMHHHRAEHWTVVQGVARVTRDDEVLDLTANQSVFLPLGCRHRLQNFGEENVEIIEVQVGDYLGEDDIVRFDDVYGRVKE